MLRRIVTLFIVQFLVLNNVTNFAVQAKSYHRPRNHQEVHEQKIDVHVIHNLDAPKPIDPYMQILAYGKTVKHFLTPRTGLFASKFTPVFTSYVVNNEVRYHRETNLVDLAIKIYQSRTSALIAFRDRYSRETHFYGSIGDMYIRPATDRPRRAVSEDFDYDQSDNGTLSRPLQHVLYPRSNTTYTNLTEALTKDLFDPEESFADEIISSHRRHARAGETVPIETKKIVYPSIVAISSYGDYGARPLGRELSNNVGMKNARTKIIAYRLINLLALYTQADLKFRHFTNPKIRFTMAAVIIAAEYSATPWITKSTKDGNTVNVKTAVVSFETFWAINPVPDVKVNSYQIVTTLIDGNKYRPIKGRIGIAKGRICDCENPTFALIFDDGAFSGTNTAVHEIGHLLGAEHDEELDLEYLPARGTIMSAYNRRCDNSYAMWARQNINEISEYLRLPHVTCADELKTQHYKKIETVLPGKYTTAANQCIQNHFDGVCRNNPERCLHLKCFKYLSSLPVIKDQVPVHAFRSMAALEGTSCGIRKICLDAQCVDDPEPNKLAWDPKIRKEDKRIRPWDLEEDYPTCPPM